MVYIYVNLIRWVEHTMDLIVNKTDLLQFKPPVIAHRGACGYAPENTMVAFAKAAQLGIKWVEFDVMLAACGEAIVFHDETLERTTNGQGLLKNNCYQQLFSLDAGKWFDPIFSGERVPTLEQVLLFLKANNMSANIEIKPLPGQEESTALKALEVTNSIFPQPHQATLFSSFSFDALRILRQQSSDCLIGVLLHEWEKNWEEVCDEVNCVSVHVNEEIMTKEMAAKIKGMGKYLLCYTVNDPGRAQELYAWGVDAVFSDVPDRLQEHAHGHDYKL